jgi:hypothetical protein
VGECYGVRVKDPQAARGAFGCIREKRGPARIWDRGLDKIDHGLSEASDKSLTGLRRKGDSVVLWRSTQQHSAPRLPSVGSGPRPALGSLLKSLLRSFGNSVRHHEARSIRGSRAINDDVMPSNRRPSRLRQDAAMGP